jgi:hypothetical protein
MLYTLLVCHLPLMALWERAALHGPVSELERIAPLIMLVRCPARNCILLLLSGRCPSGVFSYAAHLHPSFAAQAFKRLGSPQYAKNLMVFMCDMARMRLEKPELYTIWEEQLVAHSSEAEEILHSCVARARSHTDKIKYTEVRQIYRAITPEIKRTIAMKRIFRCVCAPAMMELCVCCACAHALCDARLTRCAHALHLCSVLVARAAHAKASTLGAPSCRRGTRW